MGYKAFFTVLLFTCFQNKAIGNSYSLYLVTEGSAQKISGKERLTSCNKIRAKQISTLLANSKLVTAYSSTSQAAMFTISTITKPLQIKTKHFSSSYPETLALQLKQQQDNAVIISNVKTISLLSSILLDKAYTGISPQLFNAIPNRLYQFSYIDGALLFTEFTLPITCH